jgi:hypothetical protein
MSSLNALTLQRPDPRTAELGPDFRSSGLCRILGQSWRHRRHALARAPLVSTGSRHSAGQTRSGSRATRIGERERGGRLSRGRSSLCPRMRSYRGVGAASARGGVGLRLAAGRHRSPSSARRAVSCLILGDRTCRHHALPCAIPCTSRRGMLHGCRPRPIFLSDFGLGNEWWNLPPDPRDCRPILHGADLSHLIRPMEVTSGALLLADSVPYIPENAVSLAVVEPNVGKDRELAIETTSGRAFVGPDNGLLSLAWEAAGGIASAGRDHVPRCDSATACESFPGRTPCAPRQHGLRPEWRSTNPWDAARSEHACGDLSCRAGDRARQDHM